MVKGNAVYSFILCITYVCEFANTAIYTYYSKGNNAKNTSADAYTV